MDKEAKKQEELEAKALAFEALTRIQIENKRYSAVIYGQIQGKQGSMVVEEVKQRIIDTEEQLVWLKAEKERLIWLLKKMQKEAEVWSGATYDPNWRWYQKAKFIMHRENRPLSCWAILDYLSEYEVFDKRQIHQSLSSVLNTKATEGLLRRLKKDGEKVRYELASYDG